MPIGVDAYVAHIDRFYWRIFTHRLWACGCNLLSAAKHGPHSSYEFSEPVRLGDVIISADLEADDHVELFAFGRHHDDRHPRRLTDRSAHIDARHGRQHHVEEDQVGAHLFEAP